MKKIIYLVFLTCIYTSCNSINKDNAFKDTDIKFIKEFVACDNALYSQSEDDSIITRCKEAAFQVIDSKYDGIIYILNAECSTCIGLFAKFLTLLEQANIKNDIIVIIQNSNQKIIEYYMQQLGITNNKLIYAEISYDKCTQNDIEQYNGTVLFILKNKITGKFSFSDFINYSN